MSATTDPATWTVPQTARHLGVSESTVRTLITQHKLPAFRIGKLYKIDPADVTAFLDAARRSTDTASVQ